MPKLSEEQIENLSKQISDDFNQNLKKDVSLEQIKQCLASAQKLGVTNQFITLELEEEKFIIRINGPLWPPYNRQHEANSLEKARKAGIDTNVLTNRTDYQICKYLDEKQKLSNIINSNNDENITRALSLIAKVIPNYHQSSTSSEMIGYPIKEMVSNATKYLKLADDKKEKEVLKNFGETCEKIIDVLEYYNPEKLFSHNDLLSSSIYVDVENSKVSIVDWEYAATAYWSNDLAKLGCELTEEQCDTLANNYHSNQVSKMKEEMPKSQKIELKLNKLLHDYLNIAWKINNANISEYSTKIEKMRKETEEFNQALSDRYELVKNPHKLAQIHSANPYSKNKMSNTDFASENQYNRTDTPSNHG